MISQCLSCRTGLRNGVAFCSRCGQPVLRVTAAPVTVAQGNVWAMWCHLSALGVLLFPLGGNILGPLIVWLSKREIPIVDENGKEALNFQISATIYSVIFGAVAGIVWVALVFLLPVAGLVAASSYISTGSGAADGLLASVAALAGMFFFPFLPIVVFAAWLYLVIVASVKVGGGTGYRYPLILRVIR